MNRSWAWGRRGRSDLWREVVPFWGIAFAGLVLSTWAADAATTAVVMAASLLAFGVLWAGKFAVFNTLLFTERPPPGHLHPVGGGRRAPATAGRPLRVVVVAVATIGLLLAGSASLRAAEAQDPPDSTGPPTTEPATTAPPTTEPATTAPPTTEATTHPTTAPPSTTVVAGGGAAPTGPPGSGAAPPTTAAGGPLAPATSAETAGAAGAAGMAGAPGTSGPVEAGPGGPPGPASFPRRVLRELL